MKKSDLLKMLAEDYKRTVRLPDDISLKDYRDAIERETGLKVSNRKATSDLDALSGFTSLLVSDRGKIIRVWRATPTPKRKRKTSA